MITDNYTRREFRGYSFNIKSEIQLCFSGYYFSTMVYTSSLKCGVHIVVEKVISNKKAI